LWIYELKQQLFCSLGKKLLFIIKKILKYYIFIFIGRLDSFHSHMWGDKYGEFHFAGSSGISLQKLHMKFIFKSNLYIFEHWKSGLGLNWLLPPFFAVAIDTIHFYVTFIINLVFSFIIYLILVSTFFEMLHLRDRYEILQACTQPTKVEDEPFSVP
jgi:hypothetical protein